jgi:chemotaxis protein MotB
MAGKSTAGKSMVGEPAPVRIIIKKKGGHAAAHGGVWKVAYADFITALMALFLLLWLIGSSSDEQKRAIAGYFRDDPVTMPGKPSPGVGILDGDPAMDLVAKARMDSLKLVEASRELQETLAADGTLAAFADQVLIDVSSEGMRINLVDKLDNVLFDVGSSAIKPGAQAVLAEIARVLSKLDNKIVIGGHTDSRPYSDGSGFSNWDLSTERANRARQAMVDAGLAESHLALVAGYADTRPLLKNDPEAAANRRISITVLRKTPTPNTAKRPKGQEAGHPEPDAPSDDIAPGIRAAIPTLSPGIDPGISRLLSPGQQHQGRHAGQDTVETE